MITYRVETIHLDDDFYVVHGNASEQALNGQYTSFHFQFSVPATPENSIAQVEEKALALAKANIPVIHHPS